MYFCNYVWTILPDWNVCQVARKHKGLVSYKITISFYTVWQLHLCKSNIVCLEKEMYIGSKRSQVQSIFPKFKNYYVIGHFILGTLQLWHWTLLFVALKWRVCTPRYSLHLVIAPNGRRYTCILEWAKIQCK